MKKVGDTYISSLNNGPIINYLLDENLPSKKLGTDVKLFTDLNIKKYENFINDVRNSNSYKNDAIKIAYCSFVLDIPVDETILTIKYIKQNFAKNKN